MCDELWAVHFSFVDVGSMQRVIHISSEMIQKQAPSIIKPREKQIKRKLFWYHN